MIEYFSGKFAKMIQYQFYSKCTNKLFTKQNFYLRTTYLAKMVDTLYEKLPHNYLRVALLDIAKKHLFSFQQIALSSFLLELWHVNSVYKLNLF